VCWFRRAADCGNSLALNSVAPPFHRLQCPMASTSTCLLLPLVSKQTIWQQLHGGLPMQCAAKIYHRGHSQTRKFHSQSILGVETTETVNAVLEDGDGRAVHIRRVHGFPSLIVQLHMIVIAIGLSRRSRGQLRPPACQSKGMTFRCRLHGCHRYRELNTQAPVHRDRKCGDTPCG